MAARAADPQPFDPQIDPSLSAPARFQSSAAPTDQDASQAEPIRPASADDLSTSESQRLIDNVEAELPLVTTNAEFVGARAGLARPTSVNLLEASSPLSAGFSVFKVPVSDRFWLAGRGWQRELTPGIKAVVFGAEAKVGLSNRVDLRMGYELLGTNPEQFGLTTSNHSEDSLYAQFRFRF